MFFFIYLFDSGCQIAMNLCYIIKITLSAMYHKSQRCLYFFIFIFIEPIQVIWQNHGLRRSSDICNFFIIENLKTNDKTHGSNDQISTYFLKQNRTLSQ